MSATSRGVEIGLCYVVLGTACVRALRGWWLAFAAVVLAAAAATSLTFPVPRRLRVHADDALRRVTASLSLAALAFDRGPVAVDVAPASGGCGAFSVLFVAAAVIVVVQLRRRDRREDEGS